MKYIKKFENKEPEKILTYYSNNKVKSIVYKLNGQKHREDGPAIQEWYEDEQKFIEEYFIKNEYHREDGPAIQEWHENGKVFRQLYYLHDKMHREDGPAAIYYKKNGKIGNTIYCLNDIRYNREEWIEKLKEMDSPHYEEQKKLYELEQDMEKYNL